MILAEASFLFCYSMLSTRHHLRVLGGKHLASKALQSNVELETSLQVAMGGRMSAPWKSTTWTHLLGFRCPAAICTSLSSFGSESAPPQPCCAIPCSVPRVRSV